MFETVIAVVPPVTAQSDEFEVASIHTQHPADGRFSGQNLSARGLILQAFNIEATEFQLSGGPAWIDSETYDLNAKSDVSGVISPARLQVVASNGSKLQRAAEPEGRQIENRGNDYLNALNVPVPEFARPEFRERSTST